MFQVKLFGAPSTEAPKKKNAAAKPAKEGSKVRERLTLLAKFTVESDSAVEVTKMIANALSKLTPAKQAAVIAIDARQVAKPDPNAPLF